MFFVMCDDDAKLGFFFWGGDDAWEVGWGLVVVWWCGVMGGGEVVVVV